MNALNSILVVDNKQVNNEPVQTVNARELHRFLEVKSKFIDWIKTRIDDFNFEENLDYVILKKKNCETINNLGIKKASHEYFLTLDMAKELSMVERNAKGKEARQYFIDCEKKAKVIHQLPSATGLPEYRKAKAIEMTTKAIGKIFSDLPHLSGLSKQAIYANTINPIAGTTIIPLPVIEEQTYSATEIAEMSHTTPNKVGSAANRLGLKTSEYGHFVLDKSRHSSKQVETFRYNQKGVDALLAELGNGH